MTKKSKDGCAADIAQKSILPSALANMTTIQEVHDYYQKIISCMPNNFYWLDKNCITQGCNTNVLQFIGLKKPEEFIGINYQEMGRIAGWTQEHAARYEHDDKEVMATKTPKLNIEDPPIIDKQGNITYYSSSRVPLFDDEHKEVIGIVGISVDITEQKQLLIDLKQAKERAELANEAKTEFLANMRHDIRTPLSGIVGFSEILKAEANDPQIKEYADNLIASSHALLSLMDEVLEAIKVSSGEIPLLKKKFNLSETLEHITKLYAAKASEKGLSLSLTIGSDLPQFVIGDKIRFHRIVLELVGNALNFTDSGHVTIHVDLAKKEQQALVIRLTVIDTGMGIPKDKQLDIYVQFKRLTPSYQGIYKGTGLGLYVVKQFIDELGGEIYVESEPHKGTRFTCLIPLQQSLLDDDSGIDTAEELKIEKPYMAPLTYQSTISDEKKSATRILVVEDNLIAQKVAQSILSAMNCLVDVASSGAAALIFCEKNQYDLILMDIGLGEGIDGYDVTHHIRTNHDAMKHTPIIALTAHAADENKQRCIKAGMNAVLTKPLTQAHAADILKTFVPSRQIPRPPAIKLARTDLPDSDEELFQLEQFALFDEEQGLKNCGDKETLIELLNLMKDEQIPKDLQLMKNAFAKQDYALVEQLAHKIKGGAVYVGTTRMKYACQYVERYWKTGELGCFDPLYHQAVKTIENTLISVTEWLKNQSGPSSM